MFIAQLNLGLFDVMKNVLSTSSLIWPSYKIRATIFEKVFRPEIFLKTEYFPTKRIMRERERDERSATNFSGTKLSN